MSRIRENCDFIRGNLKYKTRRIYSVRRTAWQAHDTQVYASLETIPFERALTSMQHM